MKTRDALQIIRFAAAHETQVVVMTGGEPTLRRDLPVLLGEIRSLGMQAILSTNGVFLEKRIDRIVPLLNWISLPLDGSDPVRNAKSRVGDIGQFVTVLRLIPLIRDRYPDVKIKLGTVVSRVNHSDVPSIIDVLPDEALPDVWKLYQLSYSNYGKDNREILEITDADYESVVVRARDRAERRGVRLGVYTDAEREGQYLFVDPSGDAVVIDGGDEFIIGNLLKDPAVVMQEWPKYINEERLRSNVLRTYHSSL